MSVPSEPAAPPRFSMMIGWPSAFWNRSWTMRAITSVPPPGGYGTMKRTGFSGQPWAAAASANTARPKAAARVASVMRRRSSSFIVSPGEQARSAGRRFVSFAAADAVTERLARVARASEQLAGQGTGMGTSEAHRGHAHADRGHRLAPGIEDRRAQPANAEPPLLAVLGVASFSGARELGVKAVEVGDAVRRVRV